MRFLNTFYIFPLRLSISSSKPNGWTAYYLTYENNAFQIISWSDGRHGFIVFKRIPNDNLRCVNESNVGTF